MYPVHFQKCQHNVHTDALVAVHKSVVGDERIAEPCALFLLGGLELLPAEAEAAAWGKAVAMTLLEIAAESRRSFALIHFAGSSSCQVDIFRPGEYTLEDKLTASETFLGGGTNFERPIREALRLMDTEGFEKADVVFITDGECELPDACQQELQSAQVAYHFTVTGILLDEGQSGMDFSLKPFCQKIYRTSELTDNAVVQSVIGLLVQRMILSKAQYLQSDRRKIL